MSVHSQRGKVKPPSRQRSQRLPANLNFAKTHLPNAGAPQDEGVGIFDNWELTYMLCRHVIGNIGEVTTLDNDKILGVVKAISPSGDMGLSHAYTSHKEKNGHFGVCHLVSLPNWKMVRIPDIKLSDCLTGETKVSMDADAPNGCENTGGTTEDKKLIPFFAASDTVNDCDLDEGGFPAEEMFKTNKELFSVSTSYNPELTEYTMPVDRSAPNFSETEARCAKLAKDLESKMPMHVDAEDVCEDEEVAFSAVSRTSKEYAKHSNRNMKNVTEKPNSNRSDVGNVTRQLTHISVNPSKISNGSEKTNVRTTMNAPISVSHDQRQDNVPSITNATSVAQSVTVPNPAPAATAVDSVTAPVTASDVPTHLSTPVSSEAKMKKSTLDPNAPEFQPMGLKFSSTQANLPPQAPLQQLISVVPCSAPHILQQVTMNNHVTQLPMQSLSTFVAPSQTHPYAPSTMPYGSHAGQISQILPGAIPASMTNTLQPHMRAGSLPPNLQQVFPGAPNSGSSILLQQAHQPGISTHMLTPQAPLIATHNTPGRYSGPPSSVNLTHQRSNEPLSVTSQSSVYGPPSNLSVSTLQPSLYPIAQHGAGIPLWVPGHPQNGLHFIHGTLGSSALMLGNMPVSQTSGQQVYANHAMLHMQPTQLSMPAVQVDQAPSTTQQTQQQPVFQPPSAHFQDPHHIQLPSFTPNMVFTSPQTGPNYYSAAPTMIAGPNAVNPSMQPGILPMLNQPSVQHPSGNSIGHHQPTNIDPGFANPQVPVQQFPHQNIQSAHFLQHYNAQAQLIQQQQFPTGPHVTSQAFQNRAYQTIATMVAGGNPSSQAH